jgi:hypothetical protein
MTTCPHRPTPGDLAAKAAARPPATTPARRTIADNVAPAVLQPRERMHMLLTRGIRISRLHPGARLVALTLLGYANSKSGLITPKFRPSVDQLAEDTGLTALQIRAHIEVLTQRGWLYSRRITQGQHAGQLGLNLSVPAPVLDRVRADRAAEQAATAAS